MISKYDNGGDGMCLRCLVDYLFCIATALEVIFRMHIGS
jgi:hypothetical protein